MRLGPVACSLALLVSLALGTAGEAGARPTPIVPRKATVVQVVGDGLVDDQTLAHTIETMPERAAELRKVFPDLDFTYFAVDLVVPEVTTSELARARSRGATVRAFCQGYAAGDAGSLREVAVSASEAVDGRGPALPKALVCPVRLSDLRRRGTSLAPVGNGLGLVGAGDAVASGSCDTLAVAPSAYDVQSCVRLTFKDSRIARRLRDSLRQAAKQGGCLRIRVVQPTREFREHGPAYLAIGTVTHDASCDRSDGGV